jgi:hypothetical protein
MSDTDAPPFSRGQALQAISAMRSVEVSDAAEAGWSGQTSEGHTNWSVVLSAAALYIDIASKTLAHLIQRTATRAAFWASNAIA